MGAAAQHTVKSSLVAQPKSLDGFPDNSICASREPAPTGPICLDKRMVRVELTPKGTTAVGTIKARSTSDKHHSFTIYYLPFNH